MTRCFRISSERPQRSSCSNASPPRTCLSISTRKLTTLFTKASKGRFTVQKANQLKTAAKVSFGITFAKADFSFQISNSLSRLSSLKSSLRLWKKNSAAFFARPTRTVITTIPGIGDALGAAIIGEIGDINRFDAPNKLVAFAGSGCDRQAVW